VFFFLPAFDESVSAENEQKETRYGGGTEDLVFHRNVKKAARLGHEHVISFLFRFSWALTSNNKDDDERNKRRSRERGLNNSTRA